MTFNPPLRKLVLLIHVLSSVGWTGAVAAFLALAVTGLNDLHPLTLRAVYIAMLPITWWVIFPLAIGSLVSGLFLSLCTVWGLFRHYWVIFKLLISCISLPVLLLHAGIIRRVAAAAMSANVNFQELYADRQQLVIASAAALAALVVATLLSVYKPRGRTPDRRKSDARPRERGAGGDAGRGAGGPAGAGMRRD
ncbi:MAG TPA: hypothetical protein VGS79_04685 [Puia sp.]|nr:hypothetical protein [Puia sp.]